ncbi:hypothetical protein Tsubulata_001264, partial [Turnera subulata]
ASPYCTSILILQILWWVKTQKMNRTSSSSSTSKAKTHNQKLPSAALSETRKLGSKKKQQQQQQQRDPFRDLNNCISSSSNTNSSTEIEAPRGCLRFFLSHHSSSSSSSSTKTPSRTLAASKPQHSTKSAPNPKLKANPKKCNKPIITQQKPRSNPSPLVPVSNHSSLSNSRLTLLNNSDLKDKKNKPTINTRVLVHGACSFDEPNSTPVPSSKMATGSALNYSSVQEDEGNVRANPDSTSGNSRTPPVQASLSPEIPCDSSAVSANTKTPACYAAGHVLSGVVDKRKCRPRGILTAGEPRSLSSFESDTEPEQQQENIVSSVTALLVPVEASVHWLLSPCREEEEGRKQKCKAGFCPSPNLEDYSSLLSSTPPNLAGRNDFPVDDLCNISISTTSTRERSVSPLSPADLPQFRGFLGSPLSDDVVVSSLVRENNKHSPCSTASLVSGNVIQTPQSHTSYDTRAALSWLTGDANHKKQGIFDCELGTAAEELQAPNFASVGDLPVGVSTSSSFQFDCFETPSQAVDLSKFQGIFHDRASWFSNSTSENVSQSQMRISWREGLVSRIVEMDEFDFCRCLSDEEEEVACGSDDNHLSSELRSKLSADAREDHIQDNGFVSPETIITKHVTDEKANGDCPPSPGVPCSCSESISTDGGGLACSDDSDWTLCYKNQGLDTGGLGRFRS